jgi:hypothetical protein
MGEHEYVQFVTRGSPRTLIPVKGINEREREMPLDEEDSELSM